MTRFHGAAPALAFRRGSTMKFRFLGVNVTIGGGDNEEKASATAPIIYAMTGGAESYGVAPKRNFAHFARD